MFELIIRADSLQEVQEFLKITEVKAVQPEQVAEKVPEMEVQEEVSLPEPEQKNRRKWTKYTLTEYGFPVQWKELIEAYIRKNIIFYMKDIMGQALNPNHRIGLLHWLHEHPRVIVSQKTNGPKTYVFTPFYIENGVKVLGTEGRRDKDILKGAKLQAAKRQTSRFDEEAV